jgi:serine/threonine protein kinase
VSTVPAVSLEVAESDSPEGEIEDPDPHAVMVPAKTTNKLNLQNDRIASLPLFECAFYRPNEWCDNGGVSRMSSKLTFVGDFFGESAKWRHAVGRADGEMNVFEPGACVDKYEILGQLGSGVLDVVYRARHQTLGTEVALKLLLPNLATRSPIVSAFRTVTHRQAELIHDHIIRVTDLVANNGALGVVMEFIDGPSLEVVLKGQEGSPYTLDDAVAIVGPVLDGLAYAHERDLVHMDLRPCNILMARRDGELANSSPRIKDFGLLRILEADDQIGRAYGPLCFAPYMAPELFYRRGEIDARADVFSVGMLFWRLLTGRLPIDPGDIQQVVSLYEGTVRIPPLESVVPWVPAAVATTVDAALSLRPGHRPADAGAFWAGISGEVNASEKGDRPHVASPTPTPLDVEREEANVVEIHNETAVKRPPARTTTQNGSPPAAEIEITSDGRQSSGLVRMMGMAAVLALVVVGGVKLVSGWAGNQTPKECHISDVADCIKQCNVGHGLSCDKLGQIYERGIGVVANSDEAVSWYRKACGVENPQGCENLKLILKKRNYNP